MYFEDEFIKLLYKYDHMKIIIQFIVNQQI